jgi:homoserine kinase
VASVSDPRVPLDAQRNAAAIAAAAVLAKAEADFGLELSIQKGLPLSAGLGGSAASAVAGAVAAEAIAGADLSRDELLLAALDAETRIAGRHADNVAPSLLGGMVLIAGLDPPRVRSVRVHRSFSFVTVTPDYSVETAKARSVLPRDVGRDVAVEQAARLAAFILGLERGDAELIHDSMQDLIAEPARGALFPGYGEARAAALAAGAAGVAVSGAGPSVVAVVAGGSAAAAFHAQVDRVGARIEE